MATHSVLVLGADSIDAMVALVVRVGRELELIEPPELAEAIERAASRLVRRPREGAPSLSMP